jgi:hypothetical protein
VTDDLDFETVFNSFADRYAADGDTAKLCLCRAAARVLSADSATTSEISAAIALLDKMPVPREDEPPFVLERLTTSQVNALDKLMRIGCGLEPEPPSHRRKSDTYWKAIALAALIDDIVKRSSELSFRDQADGAGITVTDRTDLTDLLVLLCHRTRRIFRVKRRVQHGQRGSVRAIATSSLR